MQAVFLCEKSMDAEQLREILHYEAGTGVFTWRVKLNRQMIVGSVAGHKAHGYIIIGIKGELYRAHRLAWLYQTGRWPDGDIDHKNGNKEDNQWENPREATRSQNMQNVGIKKNNKSGFKGVYKHTQVGRFVAQIRINGRKVHLGIFETAEEAGAAYAQAANQNHKEYARLA